VRAPLNNEKWNSLGDNRVGRFKCFIIELTLTADVGDVGKKSKATE
jgi:hypothetical protein